jgi:hypothetical protein
MHPNVKTAALALLLLTTAASATMVIAPTGNDSPLMAKIYDAAFTVQINVTVTDDVGRLMSNAQVSIVDNTSSPWTTDIKGNVPIDGLADNVSSYTLWAAKQGYLNGMEVTVPVSANETSNITLVVTGGMVYGIVSSQLGYVQDAIVSAINTSGPTYVTNVSSVDGTYAIGGLPTGYFDIVASAPGYDSGYNNSTSVSAGMSLRMDFTLHSQLGYISGWIMRANTGDFLNATNITYTVGAVTTSVTNLDDGSYLLSGLPAGTYNLTATKNGYFSEILTGIVVERGNVTSNVNFTLTEKPTKIYGTVKSGTYLQPKVNVSVVGTNVFNFTDVEGEYSLENLTAGTYTISAQLEGYALAQVPNVVLPVGGQVRVDIELVALPGAIVRGEVLAMDTHDPLISVTVTIIGSDGKHFTKETNFEGQFEFTMLADGNYTLQFEAPGYQPVEVDNVNASSTVVSNDTYYMQPVREGFTGFIFGFDLAHSMMILALFITILILAIAVYLRIRTFQAPESSPAIYDEAEVHEEEEDQAPRQNRDVDDREGNNSEKGGSPPPSK